MSKQDKLVEAMIAEFVKQDFRPVVDKGIPMPKVGENPYHFYKGENTLAITYRETWINMEVGDSILFPSTKEQSWFRHFAKIILNKDYVKRGLRFWKIKELENE